MSLISWFQILLSISFKGVINTNLEGYTTDISWMPGYTFSMNSAVDSRYLCLLCKNILKDPVQTGCGHVYCTSCIPRLKW